MRYLIFFFVLGTVIGALIYSKAVNTMPEGINIDNIFKSSQLPDKGKSPELIGIESWINSEPLTLKELRGKVVLVDFWTYSCINCIRTLPHISQWHEKYSDAGFVLLGVHSPEFQFEKKRENVEQKVREHNLAYPIALDNEHKTWRAFANQYWPAEYLIDIEGNIRYTHFGEGRYDETERAIRQLLAGAGLLSLDDVSEVKALPAGVDFGKIETPEIYLGYLRLNNIGNTTEGVKPDTPHTFSEPDKISPNRFYLSGTWSINPEFAEAIGDKTKLFIRYKANKINMVLGTSSDSEVPVELKIDGAWLTEKNKGADVYIHKGISRAIIKSPALYNLVDTRDDYGWHTLEIIIGSPGLQAFTFTFG